MLIDPIRNLLAGAATAAGCEVAPLVQRYDYGHHAHSRVTADRLRVNGHVCALSWIRTQAKGRIPGGYTAYTYATLSAVDAVLLYLTVPSMSPKVFVVPADDMRSALFDDSTSRVRMRFFVPAVLGYHVDTRMELWPYENAWHLLRKEELKVA